MAPKREEVSVSHHGRGNSSAILLKMSSSLPESQEWMEGTSFWQDARTGGEARGCDTATRAQGTGRAIHVAAVCKRLLSGCGRRQGWEESYLS